MLVNINRKYLQKEKGFTARLKKKEKKEKKEKRKERAAGTDLESRSKVVRPFL